jgi:hypothetical protein
MRITFIEPFRSPEVEEVRHQVEFFGFHRLKMCSQAALPVAVAVVHVAEVNMRAIHLPVRHLHDRPLV